MTTATKDLVVLCACKDGEFAVRGLLSRHRAFGIRPIVVEIIKHTTGKDSGCLNTSDEILRSITNQYNYALVIFDKEGCGKESMPTEQLENDVRGKLSRSGWGERADVIIIDPELDIWVWSDSPEVDDCLGWSGKTQNVREWIKQNRSSFWPEDTPKPLRPKEAMQAAMRESKEQRTSSIYQKIAEKVSVERCVDPAFLKLKSRLQEWFPVEAASS